MSRFVQAPASGEMRIIAFVAQGHAVTEGAVMRGISGQPHCAAKKTLVKT